MPIAKPAAITKQTGTALVESSIALLAMGLILCLSVFTAYFYFTKVKVSNVGYRSLICLSERQPTSRCIKNAKLDLKASLPFGTLEQYQLRKYHSNFRVNLRWNLTEKYTVIYEKKLRYR